MLIPSINNETNYLQCVLLGVANQSGPIPKYEEAYDPKSRLHILRGTYPKEQDLIHQLDLMHAALEKHGVEVLRPQIVSNCNHEARWISLHGSLPNDNFLHHPCSFLCY